MEKQKIKVKSLEESKATVDIMLECKTKEVASLLEEIKILHQRLESSSEDKIKNSLKEDQVHEKELSLQHQERRIEIEREYYTKQIDSLTAENAEQREKYIELKRQTDMQIAELESNLEQRNSEVKRLNEEVTHLKRVSEKNDQHIKALTDKIKLINDASSEMEAHYRDEIKELKGLSDYYSKEMEKEKCTAQGLLSTIDRLQALLIQGDEAQKELEQTLNENVEAYQRQIKAREKEISSLEEQINKLKVELASREQEEFNAQFGRFFPSAAAAHKIFDSNMSLSEFYEQYRILQLRLEEQTKEKQCLKQQIRELISEAENRTPFVHQKVTENRKFIETIQELQSRLNDAISERDHIVQEKEELLQTIGNIQRELQRQEQLSTDLSRQVKYLMRSVCEAKGYEVRDSVVNSPPKKSEGSANSVITQHLILFKDIEQLQYNNERLILSLRELGTRNEELESLLVDKEAVSKREMEQALNEIKRLTDERQRQAEMLDDLMKRKSTPIKRLSTDEDLIKSPQAKSVRLSIDETLADLKNALKKIAEEASSNKVEYETRIKELNKEISAYREELSTNQADKVRLESENEYQLEKMKVLETNFEQLKKQNAALTERCNKLSQKLSKAEAALNLFKRELVESKGQNKRLDSSLKEIQSERDFLRNQERLLTQEKEALRREYEEKTKYLSKFQNIHSFIQRIESDSSKGLTLQIDKLEKELSLSKEKLQENEKARRETVQKYSKRVGELELKLNEEIHRSAQLEQDLALTRQKLHENDIEIRALKTYHRQHQPASPQIEIRERLVDNPKLLEKVKELEAQLEASKQEIATMKNELQNVNLKTENQKSVVAKANQKISKCSPLKSCCQNFT